MAIAIKLPGDYERDNDNDKKYEKFVLRHLNPRLLLPPRRG